MQRKILSLPVNKTAKVIPFNTVTKPLPIRVHKGVAISDLIGDEMRTHFETLKKDAHHDPIRTRNKGC